MSEDAKENKLKKKSSIRQHVPKPFMGNLPIPNVPDNWKRLGNGSNGWIYLAPTETKDIKSKQKYKVFKIFQDDYPETKIKLERETETAQIHYRGIKKYEILKDRTGRKYFAAELEYLKGKSLYHLARQKKLNKFSFADRTRMMLQLVEQMCSLHANRIIHYDIKSPNVMIDDTATPPQAYLIDFELAYYIKADAKQSAISPNTLYKSSLTVDDPEWFVAGTPGYFPVETLGDEKTRQRGIKTDTAMLAWPLLDLLLQPNPMSSKEEINHTRSSNPKRPYLIAQAPLKDTGVQIPIRIDGFDLKQIGVDYIRKMQSPYRDRPDDESLLLFFNTLHQLALYNEVLQKEKRNWLKNHVLMEDLQTKMALLAVKLNILLKGYTAIHLVNDQPAIENRHPDALYLLEDKKNNLKICSAYLEPPIKLSEEQSKNLKDKFQGAPSIVNSPEVMDEVIAICHWSTLLAPLSLYLKTASTYFPSWKQTATKRIGFFGLVGGMGVCAHMGMEHYSLNTPWGEINQSYTETFGNIPIYGLILLGTAVAIALICLHAYHFELNERKKAAMDTDNTPKSDDYQEKSLQRN